MIQRRTLVKAVIAALAPLSMTSAYAAGGPAAPISVTSTKANLAPWT